MSRWHTQTERWLSHELHGQDAAADEAFSQVFAALPAVEASGDFVRGAVHAAWLARARRRRMVACAAVAASLVAAGAAGVIVYGLSGGASGWPLTTLAGVVTSSTLSLLMAAVASLEWWAATARASSMVAGVLAMPQSAAALLAVEVLGVAALYVLLRLLRAETEFRNPGPLCL